MIIAIKSIVPNPEQPRKVFGQAELDSLAESIKQHGLINPISVEAHGDTYILIDGERRWRAAQLAGLTEIEASVRPGMNGTGQQQRLILATVANLQREDMNPVDRAEAVQRLIQMGMSQAEVARAISVSTGSIGNYLLIFRLPQPVQELMRQKKLGAGRPAIIALLSLEDPELINAAARSAAKQDLTEPQVVILCKRMKQGKILSESRKKAKSAAQLSTAWAGKWNMISQAGNPSISDALRTDATETCRACALFEEASPKVCKDCPAVDLFAKIAARGSK